jgi:Leucine-rich repeat (LRR) protein
MSKPEQIIDLERFYNISLSILPSDQTIGSDESKNTYILNELNEVIGLNLFDNKISDLSGLSIFSNLTQLYLKNNQILDLSPISSLMNLIKLDLTENHIDEISNLTTLTELTHLYLRKNHIIDISCVSALKNLKYLILSYNLIVDITTLSSLTSLTSLHLNNNSITDISALSTLVNLNTLSLARNLIVDISPLSALTSLKSLNLSGNSIVEIPPLVNLIFLDYLFLMDNQINEISALSTMSNLFFLDLDKNQISDISTLSDLTKIRCLYLTKNKITDIGALSKLEELETLFVSENQISDVSALSELVNLNHLNVSANLISNVSAFSKLKKLAKLNLSINKISNISVLSELNALVELNLSKNQILDVSPLFELPNLSIVNLSGNSELEQTIPKEVLAADWLAVKLHIKDKTQLIDFNEVKILLLGNPNIGKSDLLEYLETKAKPNLKKSTVGIQYKKIEWGNVHLHLWDFGGQEYFHATHKLFFSPNALNIVLWGNNVSRKDEENNDVKETCFDLPYWLRSIEQLNKSVSEKDEVLVLENKIDLNDNVSKFTNQLSLANQFKNLRFTFHSVSLLNLTRTEGLNEIIKDITNSLTSQRSNTYLKYTKKIEESQSCYLSIDEVSGGDEYEKVCSAMKVFHNSGILLYFDTIIKDKVFIKPQALLDLLYNGVLSIERKDRLTKFEIEEKIKDNELGLTVDDVLNLLKHFDLVFQLEDVKDKYFIPQYLKPAPALIDYFSSHEFSKLSIQIKADNYLMSQAMLKIFTTYGKYVKGNSDEYLFWKDGIVIEKEGVLLMIKFQSKEQTIQLYNNTKGSNFNLQKEIVDFILSIPLEKNDDAKRISEKELSTDEKGKNGKELEVNSKIINWDSIFFTVEISNNGEDYAKWTDIYNAAQSNRIFSNGKWFNSRDFKPYLKNQNSMKKIFISYSKDDLVLVNSYINSLQPLVLEGTIDEPWYCTYLSPGDEVHNKIRYKMEEADIICFMCSNNFYKTSYIIEHELKPTLKRKKDGGKQLILPIIIDRCKWISENEEINLGIYAGFPYRGKPVSDFNNWNDAWYVSNWFLEQVIKNHSQSLNSYDFDAVAQLNSDIADLLERQIKGNLSR